MMMRTKLCRTALLALGLSGTVLAQNIDRTQPIQIEADRVEIDDRAKTQTWEGNVVLSQGTLQIRADALHVIQGNAGFARGIATAYGDRLARFEQRRDGTEHWIRGEAERIEYDAATEVARLYRRARVDSNGDVVSGPFIEYDARSENYTVRNDRDSGARGRVRAVLQPRTTP